MQNFFNLFSGDLKYYWILAVVGTTVFILQILLLLIFGTGDHTDADISSIDGDMHPDSDLGDFRIISFRTVVAFITFFGWGGIVYGKGGFGSFISAIISGSTMMILTAFLICYLFKLQQSGNIYAKDIIGKTGTVYLKIPAGKNDHGKVTVFTGAGTREVLAISETEIPNGATVKIVSQISQNKFLVEKI